MAESPINYEPFFRQIARDHACAELAVFDVEGGPEDFKLLYHLRGGVAVDETKKRAAISAFVEIIRPCVSEKRDGAIAIVEDPPPERPQYCLVTLAERSDRIVGAVGYIVRCCDHKDAVDALRRIQKETERFRKGPPRSNSQSPPFGGA